MQVGQHRLHASMACRFWKNAVKKDWISPHKLSLLLLIKGLSGNSEDHDPYLKCITRCRYRLSLLLLQYIQAEDVDLSELTGRLKSVDNETELDGFLLQRLENLLEAGVAGVTDLILSLDELLSGAEPVLHKTSLFGLFARRMILSFHKMTFSQVARFLTHLQSYVQSADLKDRDQADRSDISMDSCGSNEIKEYDTGIKDFPVSSKQAEYFLARQATAIQCNEAWAALCPPELQAKIADLLASSPDITEAHYVSYLNCLRQGEFKEALESLYHYFDGQQWRGPAAKSAGDPDELDREEYFRFRYAALNLASIHCRFGHRREALSALKEAIEIAQATNDHVCLEHCLGWLYRLEQEGSSHAKILLDRFVARAVELKIPYLTSLGMLSHAKHDAMTGLPPPKVLQIMATIYAINSQNLLKDLMGTALTQHASLWQFYGKSHLAVVFSQFELQHSSLPTSAVPSSTSPNGKLGVNNGEASCLSLCSLAQQHADRGMCAEAAEILSFCKKTFPRHSDLSKVWLKTEATIDHDRALQQGNIRLAEEAVQRMAAVDGTDAKYRSVLNLIHQGQFTESLSLLHVLMEQCREKTSLNDGKISVAEHQANVLLCLSKLCLMVGDPLSALPHLLHCLTLCCSHYMDTYAAMTSLYIAQVQLSLGLPVKALALVKRSMIQILSHGSLYLQSCAQFLLVKCQLASALSSQTDRKTVLLSVLPTLDNILSGFRKLEAKQKIRDVLYYQARVHDELGYFTERNQCAAEYRQILQQQNSDTIPSAMCVL